MRKNCIKENCAKRAYTSEYCRLHYNERQLLGLTNKPIRYCTTEGCHRIHFCRDLCKLHYDRIHKNKIYDKYSRLRVEANRSNQEFNISKQDYTKILNNQICHYCQKDFTNEKGYNLDRIDNSKGYLVDNVIPCCWQCNDMRGHYFTHDEFIYILKCLKEYRTLNK